MLLFSIDVLSGKSKPTEKKSKYELLVLTLARNHLEAEGVDQKSLIY